MRSFYEKFVNYIQINGNSILRFKNTKYALVYIFKKVNQVVQS